MFKPRFVGTEVEVRDGVNAGAEESFENELTHALISVFVNTECPHVEHFDRRAVLDDLSEKTGHRHPAFLTQIIHGA